ncbi:hypothetical protein ACIKTA_18485, partial [Hansschlegelia beijingensis]
QKFANLRALYGLMWTHPGKKLLTSETVAPAAASADRASIEARSLSFGPSPPPPPPPIGRKTARTQSQNAMRNRKNMAGSLS